MLKDKIHQLAKENLEDIIHIRRHLHQHPELSFKEYKTSQFVSEKLTQFDIEWSNGWGGGTGIVGIIKGKNPSKKVIALRADMDALPIQEVNEVPYKSKNEGVMHACGHDVHTASLLGAAKILQTLREDFEGTVKLIFQPGEELLPGGASLMIKEGALKNPKPVNIFGQHVHPPLEAGKVGLRAGMFMASTDELYVTVKGRGGHGAMPQDGIDPITITAQIINALQQIVSRYADPTIPSVLTFGRINTVGGATNIIPNEVKLEGTFRTMNEKWRKEAHKRMRKIAEGIAEGMGGACEFCIESGYPALINNPALTQNAKKYAIEYLGADNVVDLPLRMTGEDFAFYSQEMDACFYRLGTGNIAKGISSAVHTNTFDIDEKALEVGAGLMAWMAVCALD